MQQMGVEAVQVLISIPTKILTSQKPHWGQSLTQEDRRNGNTWGCDP